MFRNEHDMAREPLPAMVRTRPLDPSNAAVINLAKTVKTARPATASTSEGESDEVLKMSLCQLVIQYVYHLTDE